MIQIPHQPGICPISSCCVYYLSSITSSLSWSYHLYWCFSHTFAQDSSKGSKDGLADSWAETSWHSAPLIGLGRSATGRLDVGSQAATLCFGVPGGLCRIQPWGHDDVDPKFMWNVTWNFLFDTMNDTASKLRVNVCSLLPFLHLAIWPLQPAASVEPVASLLGRGVPVARGPACGVAGGDQATPAVLESVEVRTELFKASKRMFGKTAGWIMLNHVESIPDLFLVWRYVTKDVKRSFDWWIYSKCDSFAIPT